MCSLGCLLMVKIRWSQAFLFWNIVVKTKRAAMFMSRWKRLSCCLGEVGAPLKGAQQCDTHWHATENESSHKVTHCMLTRSNHWPAQPHAHTETCDIVVLSLLSNTLKLSISHKLRRTESDSVLLCADGTMPPLCCGRKKNRENHPRWVKWGIVRKERREGWGREGGVREDHWSWGWMNCSSGWMHHNPDCLFPSSSENHN